MGAEQQSEQGMVQISVGDLVRVKIGQETPYARWMGGEVFELASIPLADDYNIGDLVRGKITEAGGVDVLEILHRTFSSKSKVFFDTQPQLNSIVYILLMLGAKYEIIITPNRFGRGVIFVAHGKGLSPSLIALGIGINQDVMAKQPNRNQKKEKEPEASLLLKNPDDEGPSVDEAT